MSPVIAKVLKTGTRSVGLTLAPILRNEMQILPGEYLACRVLIVQGRRFMICEKIALTRAGVLPEVPPEVLQKAKG
jgi:hypothetical protein